MDICLKSASEKLELEAWSLGPGGSWGLEAGCVLNLMSWPMGEVFPPPLVLLPVEFNLKSNGKDGALHQPPAQKDIARPPRKQRTTTGTTTK